MLQLSKHWVWDSWYAFDGVHYHAFYLKAPRSLGDPDQRHWHAVVGHAVSSDLLTWTEVTDALVPSASPAFDDLAIWTGSVICDDAGIWRMYYTGISRAENGKVQRIGLCTSTNLLEWERIGTTALVGADSRWYEDRAGGSSEDEAWRDPWVTREADGTWRMLITARANQGPADVRGVVGLATSPDGLSWTVQKPISAPGFGFTQLEVNQIAEIDGRRVLIFCCGAREMSAEYQAQGVRTGIFAINLDEAGAINTRAAYRLTGPELYAGRLVQRQSDRKWVLMAFLNEDLNGEFVGSLSDPIPVRWNTDGHLELDR